MRQLTVAEIKKVAGAGSDGFWNTVGVVIGVTAKTSITSTLGYRVYRMIR